MHCKTLAPMPTSLAISALMMASAAFAADAQTPAADGAAPDPKSAAKDVQRLDQVTVQGWAELQPSSPKLPKSLLDTPETITIIPAVVMQQQGASSLLQVMRNAPGISMLAGEGGTGGAPGDSFTIRGFNARKDIFVDGVRDFGSYSRDPFNLSQVEIVQGPSSFLGGRGSTGGAINLVTKQPLATTFYAGSISGGTDSYKRLTVDVNQSLDNVGDGSGIKGAAFRINAVGFEADQPGRDLVSNSRGGVDANMTFGLGSPGQVSFGYFYMKQDNQPDFGLPFVPIGNNAVPGVAGYGNKVAPVDYTNYYGLVERDHEDISTNIARMTITYDFQNGVVVRNHTQYGSTNRDSILSAPRFINTTTTAINHELQSLDERDTNVTNQTDVIIKFATGSVKHIVTTGAEFAYETSLVKPRGAYNPGTSPATSAPLAAVAFPTTDLFNPDPYQPYSYSVLYTGGYSDTTAHSAALYAFDNVDFNEQWSVMAGLRWDRFSAEAKNVSSLFTGNAVTNLSRVDNMVSWRASLSYKPVRNGNIYVAAGTSFNPSAEGLTLGNAANSLNSANLGPEKSISYEIGTKWEFNRDLLLSAALFRTEKTNARTEDPSNPNDFITLNGKQHVQGIELFATGKLTNEWSVLAGYAYLNGKIDSSANPLEVGQPLSSAPRNSGNVWTTYSFPFGLDLGFGATYVGERVVNTTATRYVDGYLTLDAMASYRVTGNFSLQLNVYNLTDKQYVAAMYNTGSSGHVLPGSARSAVLTGLFAF